jgi:transposase
MRVEWTDNFRELYKERGQQRYGVRLLALWKIQEGMSEAKVCHLIGKTPKTVRQWRRCYEGGGIEALLCIQAGRGRKPRLMNQSVFERALAELGKRRKGGRIRCQDIVDYIAEKHHISYSRSGMYHVLHRLGFSWITSRSKHPKRDPQAIEAFKKTS